MGCTCEKLKLKTNYKVGNQRNKTSPPPPRDDQVAEIKHTWQILKVHIANVGVITYVSMFENRPELIEIFANFRGRDVGDLQRSGLIRQHALKVMGTIDKCISRIDEPDNLAKLLIETGAMHRKYNVPPDVIQIIFPHFLNAIKPHIEDYWTEDIATAWKTLFRIMTHYMEIGMTRDSNDLSTGDQKGYFNLLNLFAYGTHRDYKGRGTIPGIK
ncbi:globin-2 A chain-like [Mya arenaria]|uniref:globin-2 A chain-like n=1 Tax=Mya arenaria TaxID=6604 RepID=UPI0022E818C9|nr:globin-2 A chain-like [Mya arenaria]